MTVIDANAKFLASAAARAAAAAAATAAKAATIELADDGAAATALPGGKTPEEDAAADAAAAADPYATSAAFAAAVASSSHADLASMDAVAATPKPKAVKVRQRVLRVTVTLFHPCLKPPQAVRSTTLFKLKNRNCMRLVQKPNWTRFRGKSI